MVQLKPALQALITVILDEAERNPEFARSIEVALGIAGGSKAPGERISKVRSRRTPAVLNPIETARQGEAALRQRLTALSLEQLKDVVADYGMDPGKLVMKWKTANRIIDRIVEFSMTRAVKGDVFLK
jgi:hypothetical protein